jgi:FolB domain-containing protein
MIHFDRLQIGIHDLRIPTIIGVHSVERVKTQELRFHISLFLARKCLPTKDELCETVDYEALSNTLHTWVSSQRSHLLEDLAQNTARKIFDIDSRIEEVHLEIRKPGCLPLAESASVKVCCKRNE